MTMVSDFAWEQAERVLVGHVCDGMGLFRIAKLRGIPTIRKATDMIAEFDDNWQALPAYLKAGGPAGILTWDYLHEAIAYQIEADLHNAKPGIGQVRGMRDDTLAPRRDLGDPGRRIVPVSQPGVHAA
jgi:hypothetical protein